MKKVTIAFYVLVILILSIGVYIYAVNNRYTYERFDHIRVDHFTGKVEYYDDNTQTWRKKP